MAYTATHAHARAHGTGSVLRSILSRIGQMVVIYGETRSRYTEVQALQGLSDDELAARGLNRDDIIRHVYADMLYL